MEDLIFITAHCPSEEQELALEKCIDSISKSNFHIVLISHTHIPIHIQKKCNFYFYDFLNEISEDHNLLGHLSYFTDDFTLQSRLFHKTFYGFAIYRMFSVVSRIAENFGYKKIHHLEYDSEVLDINIIFENSKLLENHDSVIYTTTGDHTGFLFGPFKSFKVESLPQLFKEYDRNKIEKEVKNMENKYLENLTKKIFIESGKVFFRKMSEITPNKFKVGGDFHVRNVHFTLYYDNKNNSVNIFYNSIKKTPEEVLVIVNDKKVIKIVTQPGSWYLRCLGNLEEIQTIIIYDSSKILYKKEFDDEFKKIFKKISYITHK